LRRVNATDVQFAELNRLATINLSHHSPDTKRRMKQCRPQAGIAAFQSLPPRELPQFAATTLNGCAGMDVLVPQYRHTAEFSSPDANPAGSSKCASSRFPQPQVKGITTKRILHFRASMNYPPPRAPQDMSGSSGEPGPGALRKFTVHPRHPDPRGSCWLDRWKTRRFER
jgi:hypothetical protein